MRENRQSGSEGGEPQTNAAFLPLSLPVCVSHRPWCKQPGSSFASLRLCDFAFISPKQPGSLREIHYLNGLYLRCNPLLKSYLVQPLQRLGDRGFEQWFIVPLALQL
jgi:hypothetical protein